MRSVLFLWETTKGYRIRMFLLLCCILSATLTASVMPYIIGEAMLDIVIGENGNKLSGGQRQKLALARLLIRNPQYLVLDEATSALDKQAESEMLRMISENYLNATYIVIAHKMSAINGCNRRIILVDGKCVLDEHLSLQEDGIN